MEFGGNKFPEKDVYPSPFSTCEEDLKGLLKRLFFSKKDVLKYFNGVLQSFCHKSDIVRGYLRLLFIGGIGLIIKGEVKLKLCFITIRLKVGLVCCLR